MMLKFDIKNCFWRAQDLLRVKNYFASIFELLTIVLSKANYLSVTYKHKLQLQDYALIKPYFDIITEINFSQILRETGK